MYKTEGKLLWVMKGGLLLVPFIPFIVTYSLYFPFITGKNFAFRILIEILAVVWVWLMVLSPRFRPKLSPLTAAYTAFVIILIFATFFSISPYRSFWSSYERMEGLFGHLHLFLYFLMLGSVFTTGRDWRLFFNTSIAASAMIAVYGFVQLAGGAAIHQGGTRVDATFGNAIYLAVYLLFHLFLIAILFFQTDRPWLKWLYGGLFILEAVLLYYTASRGPLLAFLGGAVIFTLILVFYERGRLRRAAAAAAILVALIPVFFYLAKDTEFIRSNSILSRFSNAASDAASRGRLNIWKIAVQGWKERPVLGWGQENFIYVFSKYYEPSLWRNEPWFDRAHNVFLDWLTASGVLGLGAYLSIFGVALFLAYQAFRNGRFGRYEFAGVVAVLSAYFTQNLVVFDTLISYLLFFAILAWVHSLSLPESVASPVASGKIGPAGYFMIMASLLLMGYAVVIFNTVPVRASYIALSARKIEAFHEPAGKVDALIDELRKGIALNTFGTAELREAVVLIADNLFRDFMIAEQDKQKYLAFVIEELEKEKNDEPFDVRAMVALASAYQNAGRHQDAINEINGVLKISKRRQQFYFLAADAYLSIKQNEKAVELLQYAYGLDPENNEAVFNLAMALGAAGRVNDGRTLLEKHYREKWPAEAGLVGLAVAYSRLGELEKSVAVWEKVVEEVPHRLQFRVDLANAYFMLGSYEKAIAQIKKAMELEPRFKARGEKIIEEIRQKTAKPL